MSANPPRAKVLILSDDDELARIIESGLSEYLEAVRYDLPGAAMDGEAAQDPGLILVIVRSPLSEPAVMLVRASLLEKIGEVPLLIVSERPFHADPQDQTFHLGFPFDMDALHDQVRAILRLGQAPSGWAPPGAAAPTPAAHQ